MKRYAMAIAVLVALITVGLASTAPSQISELQTFFACSVIILGAAPTIAYLHGRRVDSIPLLPLHGAFYALTFGMPVFSDTFMASLVDDSALTEALLLTCLGLLCLYAGYYWIGRRCIGVRPMHVRSFYSPGLFAVMGAAFISARFLTSLVPGLDRDSTVAQLTILLGLVGICLLSELVMNPRVPLSWRAPAFVGIVVYCSIELLSGALARVFIVIVFAGLVFWNKTRKIPMVAVAAAAVIFVTLNPIKAEYRRATWGVENQGLLTKAAIFWDVTSRHNPLEALFDVDKEAANVDRIGHALTFARVVESTPTVVPYWRGETLLPMLTKPIPRLLWPDKPEERLGNAFWQEYGFLSGDDYTTSYNLPWFPELYANFGSSGVLLGALLIGVFFRYLVEKFRNSDGNDFRFYFGLTLFIGLFWAESNLSLMIGGLMLNFVALYVLFKFLPAVGRAGA